MVLIDMDMPDNCYECNLNNFHFCDVSGDEIEDHYGDCTKPKDCPLKEVLDIEQQTES